MFKYLVRRIMSLIPVIIIISIMLFGIVKMVPGDPVRGMLPPETSATPEEWQAMYDEMYTRLGLDKSLAEQYVRWIGNLVTGEFGYSSQHNKEVRDVLRQPLRNSILINIFSITLAFSISIPIGIRSAVKRNSIEDRGWQVFSLVGISMPSFFIGLSFIYIFALNLKWFPAGGLPYESFGFFRDITQWARYLFLPLLTLTISSLAGTIRYVRGAMLEAISKDYIRTARSKGLREKVVIYSHAFRNALIPVVTIVTGSLVGIFGGSAITETIFEFNGIGRTLVQALISRDFSVVLVMNLFYAILSLTANVIMDVTYALVDPRVRLD